MAKGLLIEDVRGVVFNDETELYSVNVMAGGKRLALLVPWRILDKAHDMVGRVRTERAAKGKVLPFRRH